LLANYPFGMSSWIQTNVILCLAHQNNTVIDFLNFSRLSHV
jgi:hypothetical protein